MARLLIIILVAATIMVLITYILGKVFKHARWIKYILGVIAIAVSIYLFYMSTQPSQGFEDLAYFIMVLILFPAGISGIIAAFIMDYMMFRKR